MTICFFGSYNRTYCRNRILIDGLEKNNIKILHCNSHKEFFITRYFELTKKFIQLSKNVDNIYVAYRGHLDVFCAVIVGFIFNKKVFFDIYYSLYDTYVNDRRVVKPNSYKAVLYYLLDKYNCQLADCVITYTMATSKYLSLTFKQPISKFKTVYIGGDEMLYKPISRKPRKKIIVEFHGWFTRMQGAEYFIQAAKLLENKKNIEFRLIGNTVNYGYVFEVLQKLKPKTLNYFKNMSEKKLAKKIANADISVGHLSNITKAHVSISNKMYHAISCKVALIAANYEATKELLTSGKNCLLVKPENACDLANKINTLIENRNLRNKIASSGYKYHQKYLTNKIIGKSLINIIRAV
mgnify:CR=1 FL=1